MNDNYNHFELTRPDGTVNRDNRWDTGESGLVSTARHEASKIGIDIIRQGGNAVDAAVAVGFALGVCEPNASGIGGGGFMTLRSESGELRFIDFRETAPATAKPSMWPTTPDGTIVGNAKSEGGKSICIPGEVAGLLFALERFGSMSREAVMAPAINLAENGFVVTEGFKRDLMDFRVKLKRFEEPGNPYTLPWKVGDIFVNKPLARVLRAISSVGTDAFYAGEMAQRLVKSVNQWGGNISLEDLEGFEAKELAPIRGSYRGYEIVSSPLPSSGGTHVIQILNILEQFDMSQYEVNSYEYLHILSEAFKMSFADRKAYMGDPAFAKVPIEGLVSKEYARKLAGKIQMDSAQSHGHDDPFDFEPKDTTHFSIADRAGNMVSVTKTISAFFGSGVVPEETGMVFNCQMRGFVQGEGKANSVGPGKKPLSSMSPTLILKDGKPFAVLGSPGGNRIISTVVQVISKLIDHEMGIQEAINSPRISNDIEGIMFYEDRISEKVVEALKKSGHETKRMKDFDRKLGGVQGIKYCPDGSISGGADPRRDGIAIGY